MLLNVVVSVVLIEDIVVVVVFPHGGVSSSFLWPLYPAQGLNGFRAYPGNAGHEGRRITQRMGNHNSGMN